MCLEHQKPGTREDTVPPSLEVLAQHLQETYTVTSVISKNNTATITFVHANKRGEASRVEYPNVPLARAVELGNLAVQHLMRHPQGDPVDVASGAYALVTTSETSALRRAAGNPDK